MSPDYRGRGFATEAVRAVVAHSFESGRVAIVRAHTMPEPNASTHVLRHCGFQNIGKVVDPEDGLIWRWEKSAAESV